MKVKMCMIMALLSFVLFSGNVAAADQTITIQMGLIWPNDREPLWNGIARDYEAAHPGVKIEFITERWPGTENLTVWAAAGVLPDIFYINDIDVVNMARAGILADITSFVQMDNMDLNRVLTAPFLSTQVIQGKLYTFPFNVNTWFTGYNRDMLERLGIGAPGPSWTFDELRAIAQKGTRMSGDQIESIGYECLQPGNGFLETFIGNFDAWVFDARGNFVLDSSTGQAALRFWRDLIDRGYLGPKPLALAYWLGGRAAVTITNAAWLGNYSRQGSYLLPYKWGVQVLPAQPGVERYSIATTGSFGLAATSKHPKEAWEFLKYITLGKAGFDAFVGFYGGISSARAHLDETLKVIGAMPNAPENLMAVMEMSARSVLGSAASAGVPNRGEVDAAIAGPIGKYWQQQLTLPQALSDAKIGVAAAIAKGQK